MKVPRHPHIIIIPFSEVMKNTFTTYVRLDWWFAKLGKNTNRGGACVTQFYASLLTEEHVKIKFDNTPPNILVALGKWYSTRVGSLGVKFHEALRPPITFLRLARGVN